MKFDPAIQEELDMIAQIEGLEPPPLEVLREVLPRMIDHRYDESGYEPPEVAEIRDLKIPVDGDEIDIRVVIPEGDGPFGGYVHFHGGAFRLGTIHSSHTRALNRYWAANVPCVVVDVEYRLAPEHKFPTGPEDCYAALLWTAEHAAEIDVDPERLAVGGESAGGTLATVIALMARDRGGPKLRGQILEIPAPDMVRTLNYPSFEELGDKFIINPRMVEQTNRDYLPTPEDAHNPYASPMLADLSGLPPAHVMTAEFDPLRDCGEEYAKRLEAAGVPTTSRRHAGHIHGSANMFYRWGPALEWEDEVCEKLRGMLAA
jgi:acetyl esterase/lipase